MAAGVILAGLIHSRNDYLRIFNLTVEPTSRVGFTKVYPFFDYMVLTVGALVHDKDNITRINT